MLSLAGQASAYRFAGQTAIPMDAQHVRLALNGTIQLIRPDDVITDLCRIQLAIFSNPELLRGDGEVLRRSEMSGAPLLVSAGSNEAGFIRQGWREVKHTRVLMGMRTIISGIIIVSIAWATYRIRSTIFVRSWALMWGAISAIFLGLVP